MGATLDTTFLNLVTREKFLPTMKNQIYKNNPILNKLVTNGQKKDASGTSLKWDEVIRGHEAKGLFSGYDILASQPINPVGAFTEDYAQYYSTLSIAKDEMIKNSGNKEKLFDMVTIQTKNARATFNQDMGTALYGAGTAVGGKTTLAGLQKIVSATNTYAGYNRSTAANAFWRSTVDGTGYTLANLKDSTTTSYLPSIMRTNLAAATYDAGPNVIATTDKIYNLYQDIAGAHNLRIDNSSADLGFKGVTFGAGVTMIADKNCTTNYMYMLTTDDFELYVFSEADFTMDSDGWVRPPNQLAYTAHIIWMGQIICRVPRQQAVLTSVGAS